MGLTPQNPVVGGEFLRRAAIKSPNYIPATSGWSINQDGTAEFNNGTFRGFIVGGSLFIYNGTPAHGNPPILSVTNQNTDPFGNPVVPGSATYDNVNNLLSLLSAGVITLTQITGAPGQAIILFTGASLFDVASTASLEAQDVSSTIVSHLEIVSPTISNPGAVNLYAKSPTAQGVSGIAVNIGGTIQFIFNTPNPALDTVANLYRAAAGILGTDAAFRFKDQGSAPATPSGASIGYSAGGQQKYASSDGNDYSTGRMSLRTSADQTINNTVAVPITGLSGIPVAAQAYRVHGIVRVNQGAVTANQNLGWQGNLSSGTRIFIDGVAGSNTGTAQSRFPNEVFSNTGVSLWTPGANTAFALIIDGVIVFTAADTFGLTMWNSTSGDTCTVKAGSFLDLEPM